MPNKTPAKKELPAETQALAAIEGLVQQADAQKLVGDKYLSVSFKDVEILRKILAKVHNQS